MVTVESRWEPYEEYIVRKTWMDGRERLLFKYGPGNPIPEWEHEMLDQKIKQVKDELKK